MKNILKFLFLIFTIVNIFGVYADTETLNWYVDNTLYTTTNCESGGDVALPTPPTKPGYIFRGWQIYTPVEYIQSTGEQYIDTEFHCDGGCTIEAGITPINNSFYVGSTCSTQENTYATSRNWVDTNKFAKGDDYNHPFSLTNFSYPLNIYLKTSGHYFIATINNQSIANLDDTPVLPAQTQSVKIGYKESANIYKQKNHYIKIWDNADVLVRDMIPVLDSNGTPCMYDKVKRKFYYNAGTGDFIAGPEIL